MPRCPGRGLSNKRKASGDGGGSRRKTETSDEMKIQGTRRTEIKLIKNEVGIRVGSDWTSTKGLSLQQAVPGMVAVERFESASLYWPKPGDPSGGR
jgi:hypothetical protein